MVKASIPDASVATLSVGTVDVRQVAVGPMDVGRLVLNDLHVDLSTGEASFEDLRVTITLDLRLDWRVTIKIPLAGNFSWNGTVKMGSHSFTVRLGDLTVPGLRSFSLDLPSSTVDRLQAVVAPLQDLHLGQLLVEQLRLQGITAPVPDLTVTGLGIGRIGLAGLGVPAATSTTATIERVSGGTLPIGQVTIPDLRVPEVSAGRISSESIDASGTSNTVRFVADAGVLTLTLHTTPGARIRARELRLSNLRTGVAIGAVELHDVVLPYELLGLTLADIGIGTIDVPVIEVV
jgi:hypothetical protein